MVRYTYFAACLWACSIMAVAQAPPRNSARLASKNDSDWRGTAPAAEASTTGRGSEPVPPAKDDTAASPPMERQAPTADPSPATESASTASFPGNQGQIWRDYDLRPFSRDFPANHETDREVLDWILRETGNDTWFRPPLGALNVTKDTVRVYHTAQVQATVADVVRRLVRPEARKHTFTARVITVGNGNWRAKALPMLKPIQAQTAGVEAWTLAKENAALLFGEMKKRPDVHELTPTQLVIKNGETYHLTQRRPRTYPQTIRLDGQNWPGYQLNYGQIEEGYALDISPLLGLDGRSADVVIRGSAQQIERMLDTWLDVPHAASNAKRVQVQVPQLASWQIHERFQWPTQEVLLISRGIVATPDAAPRSTPLPNPLTPLAARPPRSDALLIVECMGAAEPPSGRPEVAGTTPPGGAPTTGPSAARVNTRGRY